MALKMTIHRIGAADEVGRIVDGAQSRQLGERGSEGHGLSVDGRGFNVVLVTPPGLAGA